jgi:hypothetical protein
MSALRSLNEAYHLYPNLILQLQLLEVQQTSISSLHRRLIVQLMPCAVSLRLEQVEEASGTRLSAACTNTELHTPWNTKMRGAVADNT